MSDKVRYQLIGRRWRVTTEEGEVLHDGLPRRVPHEPAPPISLPQTFPVYGKSRLAELYRWGMPQLCDQLGVPAKLLEGAANFSDAAVAAEQFDNIIRGGRSVGKSTSLAYPRRLIVSLPRAGWREFKCASCGQEVEIPTRDCWSPSAENCSRCGEYMSPIRGWLCNTLVVDDMANLVDPPDEIVLREGTEHAGHDCQDSGNQGL